MTFLKYFKVVFSTCLFWLFTIAFCYFVSENNVGGAVSCGLVWFLAGYVLYRDLQDLISKK